MKQGKKRSLFDRIVSFENLLPAYKKAAKGCRKTTEVSRFNFFLEKELLQLNNELSNGKYRPASYRYFTIFDPKKRTIAVAPFRDRVVHHAIINIIEPIFEKGFIFDSYASIKNKGTHKAVKRAQTFMRRRPWYVKADIEQFFDSIDHKTLINRVKRKIKDKKALSLMETVVQKAANPCTGLPIGNLTSQFFANLYLDEFDHYIKDQLGIKCYLRYMDDFVIFGWSRKQCEKRIEKADFFLKHDLGLTLKQRVTYIAESSRGLSFLGMRVYPGTIRVRSENKRRSIKRIYRNQRKWKGRKLSEHAFAASLESVMAHLTYFNHVRYNTDTGA